MPKSLKNIMFFVILTAFIAILIVTSSIIKQKLTNGPLEKASFDSEITVVLDAGHGGEDGGAVGNANVFEKDLNLQIALKLGQKLEEKDITVIYTRTEDILLYDRNIDYTNRKKALDLAQRVKIAQETPNCVFVSIHMNSFPESKYHGFQVYYSKNNPLSRTLATSIQSEIKNQLQPDNKRKATEATSKIFLLDRLECPAILIECGFLSNPEECRLLTTNVYQNQICDIIAEKIQNYVEKYSQTY